MAPTIRNFFLRLYKHRYLLTYLTIGALAALAFLYRLGDLTPGPHSAEIDYTSGVQSITSGGLFNHIVFFPHVVLTYLVTNISVTPVTIRLTSAIFAASLAPMLYVILRIWHTKRIATVGIIILLSSSWFIGLARLGTSDIMYAWGIMAAITAETLIFHHRKHVRWRPLVMLLSGILFGLSLYNPYSIYIYILTAAIAHDYIRQLIKELGRGELTILSISAIVTSIPLLIGLVVEPSQLLALVGLPPSGLPSGIYPVLLDMKEFFSDVFWRSSGNLITSVGTLPLLGLFGASMAALGMYHYEQHRHNLRTHLVIGLFFGMFLIVALDYAPEKTATALSLVYILIAMGIVTLLAQWYRIFPRNPFARVVGFSVVTIFVLTNIAYHNQRYFSAWAHSPEVKVSFSDDVILLEDELNKLASANGYKTVELIANLPQYNRVYDWLDMTLEESVVLTDNNADIVVLGPKVAAEDIDADLSKYELETKLKTTSILEPEVYQIYIPKSN